MSNHPKAEGAVRGIKAMMAEGKWHQSDYERLDNVQCQVGNLLGEIAELEARVAELDRLNTDLAMESHALQARVAELEAGIRTHFDFMRRFSEGNQSGAVGLHHDRDLYRMAGIREGDMTIPPTPQEDA